MKKYLKILTVLALTGLVVGLFVYFFVINKSHPDYASQKPDYSLAAVELFEAYRNSAETAGNQYNGRMVMLNGSLSKVEQQNQDVYLSFIVTEGLFGAEGVRIRLLENQKAAAQKLIEGDEISVKGYVTGYNDTDVLLEHGSLASQHSNE